MTISLTFSRTWALWGLAAILPLLVVVFAVDGQLRRRVIERIGHLPQVRRMLESMSRGRRRFKAVLFVAGATSLAIAATGPQLPGTAHVTPQRGLDLVVCLDFSKSMLAADVYPSRLTRARAELNRLIDGLKGDRVGLVAFAGVTLAYPMTTDYAAAKLFWRDLSPNDIPVGGTDLGGAIRAGVELIEGSAAHAPADTRRDGHKPAQVIVLLTDGDDTEGQAMAAAHEAAAKGVRVFAVGIGSPRGELVALERAADGTATYLTDAQGTPVRMVLDTATLREIALSTGGDFFQVDPERFGVERVAKAIADLERVEEEARVIKEPEDIAGPFVCGGFLLLALEAIVRESRKRKPPQAPPANANSPTGNPLSGVALVLLFALPALTGFHFFERPSPEVEEGNKLLAEGKAKEAIAAYDRALALHPDDPAIHFDRGAALHAAGQFPEAQREFERAADGAGGDTGLRGDATYDLGNTLLAMGKPKEAIDAFKRVLALRPTDRQARWNLELALRKLKEEEQKKQEEQSKKDQQKSDDQKKDDKDQKPDDQKKDDQAKQDDKNNKDGKPGDKSDEEKKKEQAAQEQKKAEQEKKAEQKPAESSTEKSKDEKKQAQSVEAAQAGQRAPKDTEKQDAEAVLDAFEAVEPTVQKDLARRRAGNRRPKKDW